MKIGLLSDTHNYADNARVALEAFRDRDITWLLHAGDVTNGETLSVFAGWKVTLVYGNMDQHRNDLIDVSKRLGLEPPQFVRELRIDGKGIALTHGDDAGRLHSLMMSGKYRYVIHGHTHERRDELRNVYGVRVINPGALGGSRPQSRSIAILDLLTDQVEFIEFPQMR